MALTVFPAGSLSLVVNWSPRPVLSCNPNKSPGSRSLYAFILQGGRLFPTIVPLSIFLRNAVIAQVHYLGAGSGLLFNRPRLHGWAHGVYTRSCTAGGAPATCPFSGFEPCVMVCGTSTERSAGGVTQMGPADVPVPRSKDAPAEGAVEREELVYRVASSSTFERSPRLKAFFLHVCRCALDNKPEAATEHQVGICVYDRPPGYNPNEDNIVRSQARLLRMKLEHYFANEGKDEAIVITIPKGRYLPVFETRSEAPVHVPRASASPFATDPYRISRAVRTRNYMARLPAVPVEISHSRGFHRSRRFSFPPGTERGESAAGRISPRRRRNPYRRRSYGGSLRGRMRAPVGS